MDGPLSQDGIQARQARLPQYLPPLKHHQRYGCRARSPTAFISSHRPFAHPPQLLAARPACPLSCMPPHLHAPSAACPLSCMPPHLHGIPSGAGGLAMARPHPRLSEQGHAPPEQHRQPESRVGSQLGSLPRKYHPGPPVRWRRRLHCCHWMTPRKLL